MGRKALDLTGQRKEHFTIQEFAGRDHRGIRMWLCVCDCGNRFKERANRLSGGPLDRQSCGCVQREGQKYRTRTHGMTGSPEFKSWDGAKRRCNNPNDKDFPNYGGRGIRFSEAWAKFEDFYRDMGPRPGPGYSLDRIDVNGDYEPGNCRWATAKLQSNNRRENVMVRVNGAEISLFAYYGSKRSASWQRASYRIRKGWSVADAIFQPAASPSEKRLLRRA